MYLEYRKKHGQTTLQAKTSAALEVIEGIDADQDLVRLGCHGKDTDAGFAR
jgi:hypothetical protein